jgi:peptidoglycan/LPS O-acetylase OafA/YrhL
VTIQSPQPPHKHTFTTLDALRGVAALVVVFYHSSALSAHLFQHGYLAVDFFFGLSGFVLSYAYGERLASGWPASRFFRVRFIRLFPLSTLGLLFGLAVAMAGVATPVVNVPSSRMPVTLIFNLFLLPDPAFQDHPLFPYNLVSWSLFFELVSNAIHVFFLRRARTGLLISLAVVAGTVYVAYILHWGSANIGYDSFTRVEGFVRVLFSYLMGMLLFRVWRSYPARLSVSPALMCLLLTIVLAMPTFIHFKVGYDVLCVVVLLPSVILLSSYGRSGTSYAPALQVLGVASYAIYVLQSPVLSLLNWLSLSVAHRTLANARPWSSLVVLPVMLVIALAADRYFDVPVRRSLSTHMPKL